MHYLEDLATEYSLVQRPYKGLRRGIFISSKSGQKFTKAAVLYKAVKTRTAIFAANWRMIRKGLGLRKEYMYANAASGPHNASQK